jgi:hypothetical protein
VRDTSGKGAPAHAFALIQPFFCPHVGIATLIHYRRLHLFDQALDDRIGALRCAGGEQLHHQGAIVLIYDQSGRPSLSEKIRR